MAETTNDRIVREYTTLPRPEAFSGINNVAREQGVSNERAARALSGVESYTLHRQYRRPAHKNPYYIYQKRQQWQIDLIFMDKLAQHNDSYKYILVTIDCFSRKCWARPLRSRLAAETVAAMADIFDTLGGQLPKQIFCDRGTGTVK